MSEYDVWVVTLRQYSHYNGEDDDPENPLRVTYEVVIGVSDTFSGGKDMAQLYWTNTRPKGKWHSLTWDGDKSTRRLRSFFYEDYKITPHVLGKLS